MKKEVLGVIYGNNTNLKKYTMKKFITKVTVLLSLLTVVACSEDALIEDIPIFNNDGTIKEICITGKDFQFEGETRSSVSISESGASFLWDEDDVIGIFPNEGDQVSFAMSEGAGTQTATFSGGGWALKSSATYAAYYPHVYENRDMTKIPVSYLGQAQNGNNNTDHIGAYDFMAAAVSTPSNGSVAFDMQHLGCLVQLTITIPQPATLNKLTLNSSTYFTETGFIDLSASIPSIVKDKQSKDFEIVLTDITTTEANEKVTIYLMMAPVNLTGNTLTATVEFEDGTTHETDITGKNLESGKAYALAEVDRRLFTNATTEVQPTQNAEGVYLIKSASNLLWFMNNCKWFSGIDYRSCSYKLETDIIFEGKDWIPLSFGGTFDGGNHVIENASFYGYNQGCYGFFSRLTGTVKNLIFKNPSISQSGDNDYNNVYSGVLAAEGGGTIINCGIIGGSVSITSTSKAGVAGGGLIGKITWDNTVIKGCYVIGTQFTGRNYGSSIEIGGLIGKIGDYSNMPENVTITSCYTKNITVPNSTNYTNGTLIGSVRIDTYSTPSTITTCYYDATNKAIGFSPANYSFTNSSLEALYDENFIEALTKMNENLSNCDYIFGEDGTFVKK